MPTNLVRSKQDEADWAEARRIVDKQYPDKSPDDKDKSYWKLTTSIYENIKKNRGKKQMQKQASVGELLAGQVRLRKQADDNRRRGGIGNGFKNMLVNTNPLLIGGAPYVKGLYNRVKDKWNGWFGRNESNPRVPQDPMPNRTPDPMPERAPLPSPRQPLPAPNRFPTPMLGGDPVPLPRRLLDPAPAPMPFPIPRGIRGPWGRPDEQPNDPMPPLPRSPRFPMPDPTPNNDPMENERIRRLIEGNKAPAPGGGWGRPVDDSEIPLPSEDPGGWAPSNKPNTPPNTPLPRIDPEIFEKIKRDWKPRFEDPGFWVEPKSKPGSLQDWYWRNRPMSREL